MTKRFQNFRNTEKCDEKHEDITLLEAIKSEKGHIARQILLEKQFSNLESQDRRRDGTSLFWATVKGLDDIVELLIWNGANLTSRNRTGCTPLHAACDGNQLEIARMLLKWGAPIDILNKNGDSCLHMASSRGHLNIVKLLLDMGTLATQHHNHSGKTPIQSAEANEYWQVVNTLKEHLNKEKSRNEKADGRTSRRDRNRDLSRKRGSTDFEEETLEMCEKIKCIPKEKSSSNHRPKPKRDSSKKNQTAVPADVYTESKDTKAEGAKLRTRNKVSSFTTQDTRVKTLVESASVQRKKQPNLAKSSSWSISPGTSESFDYPDSLFKPYLNSSLSSSKKRSMPLRLQSLPHGGYTQEPNDLNKN